MDRTQTTPGRSFYRRNEPMKNISKLAIMRGLTLYFELDHLSMYKQ